MGSAFRYPGFPLPADANRVLEFLSNLYRPVEVKRGDTLQSNCAFFDESRDIYARSGA